MRVLAGVGAWMLGVGAATAGSLLAVSLLGQGIASSTSQQLTTAAVNRALAAEADETPGAAPATTSAPGPAPSGTRSYRARESSTLRPQTGDSPSPGASASRPAASASATANASPASTVLTSPGGTVVADCRTGGAYLVSWSPDPGYESGTVIRGPVPTARVTFISTANSVTMMVSCSAGMPVATTTVGGSRGWGDGGGPGDE